eukprot:TRINITY_DN5758_c0_g1_i1.p1 TRINITY_DN5758_c0_g1~~TRINITY_DN5758_c0_g1_i1.p1  ORF type:complete len:508 (+),score=99.21 TRINITY_DN5758_c0_g1_i1:183-1526(+)
MSRLTNPDSGRKPFDRLAMAQELDLVDVMDSSTRLVQFQAEVKAREERAVERDKRLFEVSMREYGCLSFTYAQVGKLRPLIYMYKFLAPEPAATKKYEAQDTGRLRIQIPDTLVFGEGENIMWFYTCKNGYVHRRHDFDPNRVMKKFARGIDDETTIVAVMKKVEGEDMCNTLTLLDVKALAKLVQAQTAGKYIVQHFLHPRDHHATMYRVFWRAHKPSQMVQLRNRLIFNDPKNPEKLKTCVTVSDDHRSMEITRIRGRACIEPLAVVERVVEHLKPQTKFPRLAFDELVCDMMKDDQGRWQLLQVKAFKAHDAAKLHGEAEDQASKKTSSATDKIPSGSETPRDAAAAATAAAESRRSSRLPSVSMNAAATTQKLPSRKWAAMQKIKHAIFFSSAFANRRKSVMSYTEVREIMQRRRSMSVVQRRQSVKPPPRMCLHCWLCLVEI